MITKEQASLRGRSALIIGASSGVGRATAELLIAEGAHVVAIARHAGALDALRAEVGPVQTIEADAARSDVAQRLLREFKPELVVLTAGVHARLAPLDEQTWESVSEPWNVDAQAAFHLVKAALTIPLSPGSTVVVVSSGAAIGGSPLSGGYAGAKRMQWLFAEYAQELSERKGLGIRFVAVLPAQLIEGTEIGESASAAYGALRGMSGADYMKARFEEPLDVAKVADAIVSCLRGDIAQDVAAIGITGQGIKPLE
ncbi:MAG TPA: SDR family oxidoreductase [Candidatus Tumulicola sp.]